MKKSISIFLISLISLSFSASAQDLISVKELMKVIRDKNTVVISCEKPENYKKMHITGSVNIWHNDLYKEGPVKYTIKSANELAAIFAKKGVSNTNNIILYDEGSYKYSGRIYWILKYLGCENVKILNGNVVAWKEARKPITASVIKRKPASFTPKVNNNILASMQDVKAGSYQLVDARETSEFTGESGKTEKLGHIPGAINLVYTDLYDDNKIMKSKEEIAKLVASKGISANKPIILYCNSSVRAAIIYMALTSILGYENVKIYDGAFYEWISNPSNPVATK